MEKINLDDYRCICGKLLFKGVVMASLVEIKCKRCSRVTSFGNLFSNEPTFSFLVLVDKDGTIKDICKGAEVALRYAKSDIVGMPIDKVCPMVHDYKIDSKKKTNYYTIKNNNFLLRDGNSLTADSYFITAEDNGGYYMFNKLKV